MTTRWMAHHLHVAYPNDLNEMAAVARSLTGALPGRWLVPIFQPMLWRRRCRHRSRLSAPTQRGPRPVRPALPRANGRRPSPGAGRRTVPRLAVAGVGTAWSGLLGRACQVSRAARWPSTRRSRLGPACCHSHSMKRSPPSANSLDPGGNQSAERRPSQAGSDPSGSDGSRRTRPR